jgi:hypothetical protein
MADRASAASEPIVAGTGDGRARHGHLVEVQQQQQEQRDRLLEKVARYEEAIGGELAPGRTPAIY